MRDYLFRVTYCIFIIVSAAVLFLGCSSLIESKEDAFRFTLDNPYEDVVFSSVNCINAISHEHIRTKDALKNAYQRGIRFFACVSYNPAVPPYPLSLWEGTFEDLNFVDVSYSWPNKGLGNSDIYSSEGAKRVIPNTYMLRQKGLVIGYKDSSGDYVYEKLTKSPLSTSDNDWFSLCKESSAWLVLPENRLEDYLETVSRSFSGSIPSFILDSGEIIPTSSLPQVPNAEHPTFVGDNGVSVGHFNILGSTTSEPGWSKYASTSWRLKYASKKVSSINSLFLNSEKIFGTINHNSNIKAIKYLLNNCPDVFKAMELFNQSATRELCQKYRDSYDKLLSDGYRIWGTSAVDWQGYREEKGFSGQDMESYKKECGFDRGCNVLLIDDWNNMTVSEQSEAGLEAFINGRYYMSGLGNHHIKSLTESDGVIRLEVDGNPSRIRAITANEVISLVDNSIAVCITEKTKYIRFEVFYYNDKNDMDFIFTNPVFVNAIP